MNVRRQMEEQERVSSYSSLLRVVERLRKKFMYYYVQLVTGPALPHEKRQEAGKKVYDDHSWP